MTTTSEPGTRLGDGKWLAFVAGLFVWLLAVYVPYYVVHKPIGAAPSAIWDLNRRLLSRGWSPAGLWESASNLGAGLLIVVVAVGVGWQLLRLWPEHVAGRARSPRYSPLLARLCFAGGLGLGALGLAVFVLAAAGLLYDWAVYVLLGLAGLWGVSGLRHGLPAAPERGALLGSSRLSFFETMLLGYVALSLILTLIGALTPPTAWDSLVYHLTAPKLSLLVHGLNAGVDIPHFYFPELVEMLFTLGMVVQGPIVAQLLHVAFLVFALLALYGFALAHFDRRVALLACAILGSAPSVLILSSQAYVDTAGTLFLFLSFWALYEAMGKEGTGGGRSRPRTRSWLVLSAVFAGLAMSVKYTSAPFVLGLALLVVWGFLWTGGGWRAQPIWRRFLPVVGWCGVALAVASPWYLKNLILTGNPVYPFIFPGWAWDEWRAAWYLRAGTGLLDQPARLILAPVEMTILGIEGGEGYQATIGPLFLLALPLTVVVLRKRAVRWALLVCGVAYVAWLVGVAESRLLQQTRLLLPIFGLLAVLEARALEELRQWNRPALDLRRVMGWAVLMALGLNLVAQVFATAVAAPWAYAVGAESREEYLARQLGAHDAIMRYLDQELPAGSRVWFLWEPRSFYTDRGVQPDGLLDNWPHALHLLGTPERVRGHLRERGFTHVLVYRAGLAYLLTPPNREIDDEQLEALRQFERSHLKLVWGDGLDGVGPGVDPASLGTPYAVYALR